MSETTNFQDVRSAVIRSGIRHRREVARRADGMQ